MKSSLNTLRKRVDLNLLVVFDAIYRADNLGAAGEAIGLSQPAMSHALSRLRSLMKDPLFVRLPRGLRPTPYADAIAPAVTGALSAIRAVLTQPGFDPATSPRVFRLAMTDIGERVVLPRLCAWLAKHAPGVAIETCQPDVRELVDGLASGEIDLAVGVLPDLGAGIRQHTFAHVTYVCMVRARHPSIRDKLTLEQFRAASHVIVTSGASTATGHAQAIERALRSAKARIAVRNAHYLALPGLVLSTDLVATLPKGIAVLMQENMKLKVLEPPIALPKAQARIYWHERYHREPGNQWLRGYLTRFRVEEPRAVRGNVAKTTEAMNG
jgi:DNA-binding transcriptional LysR family regulator